MVKKEDLIEGEIYFQKSSYEFIFVYRKDITWYGTPYGSYLCVETKNFYITCKSGAGNTNNIRHATYEEKQHLLACIQAGKYVEPQIIQYIEIW